MQYGDKVIVPSGKAGTYLDSATLNGEAYYRIRIPRIASDGTVNHYGDGTGLDKDEFYFPASAVKRIR